MNNAKGIVFKFGDNVDTDVIIPARYLNSSDPAELATHCMEDIDKDFIKNVKKGDIIVAEKNFGCGSSREHAPIAIKAAGVSCVIAETFARIFYRNAINIGLPIIECPEASRKSDQRSHHRRELPGTGIPRVHAEDHCRRGIDQLYQQPKIETAFKLTKIPPCYRFRNTGRYF